MATIGSKFWDMLRLVRHGGPALCNIAVTNSCNATCDFCNFANGKVGRKDLRWMVMLASAFFGAILGFRLGGMFVNRETRKRSLIERNGSARFPLSPSALSAIGSLRYL
jgi:hypothetical protein